MQASPVLHAAVQKPSLQQYRHGTCRAGSSSADSRAQASLAAMVRCPLERQRAVLSMHPDPASHPQASNSAGAGQIPDPQCDG